MKKVLLTAFEPFGGRGVNPALQVMEALKPAAFKSLRLHKAALPVSGRAIGPKIRSLIAEFKPDYIISLGLAEGEAAVRVERFALNILDYRIKDNAGWRPEGGLIQPSGPAAYFVNSDPVRMAAAIAGTGAPVYVSNHAGAYVCNTLMYEALHALAAGGLKTKFAFIHLPLTTVMAAAEKSRAIPPSLPLELLVQAAAAAIKGIK
jgi:pyroglutamyl-peptidase